MAEWVGTDSEGESNLSADKSVDTGFPVQEGFVVNRSNHVLTVPNLRANPLYFSAYDVTEAKVGSNSSER